eukprot:CAMPEP_0171192058 /NCGR_PEP_ID=MMETSP0790-20130122/19678_1 /TAXON_ID=2925 /ORGANISM="Alexandrium catenella, Strain OF101" /LENGTH=82 /DNA_ID=CAMNT_0011657213 /DNA_START=155 /DNA_END=401 /DNA_ORIENTATION=+
MTLPLAQLCELMANLTDGLFDVDVQLPQPLARRGALGGRQRVPGVGADAGRHRADPVQVRRRHQRELLLLQGLEPPHEARQL